MACGGSKTKKDCISWQPGQPEWTHFHNLSRERADHSAVVLHNGLLILVGGEEESDDANTLEIVQSGIVIEPPTGGGHGTCAVAYQSGFVTIGGYRAGSHSQVDRYDSEGSPDKRNKIPDINKALHACAAFISATGEEALLIAGGASDFDVEKNTEIFLPSKREWIITENMDRKLFSLRVNTLKGNIILTGGFEDDGSDEGQISDKVYQYNSTTEKWVKFGRMKTARHQHTTVEISTNHVCPIGKVKTRQVKTK